MKSIKITTLIFALLVFAFLAAKPVYADGSTNPYGGHTPVDTGTGSFDAFYALGFSTFSVGTTLLSIASYTKSKIRGTE